jgi:hypothetical protein
MPRPLVVVVSGKTQMSLVGFCSMSSFNVYNFASLGGVRRGGEKAMRIARKRVMRSTLRVWG